MGHLSIEWAEREPNSEGRIIDRVVTKSHWHWEISFSTWLAGAH